MKVCDRSVVLTTLLFRMARNHGRDARVTTAASSCFVDKHRDLIYKQMYGAKIIFEDRKSFRIPVKFLKSEPLVKSICNHTASGTVRLYKSVNTVLFEADV